MRLNYTRAVILLTLLLVVIQVPILSVQGDLSDLSKVTGTTQPLYDISWKPDGRYALISGGNGIILKFDGTNFTTVKTTTRQLGESFESLAWKPDGGYALIVGWYGTNETGPLETYGTIIKYDGNMFTTLSEGIYPPLYGIGWNKDYALIVGAGGTVLKYDGKDLRKLDSGVNTGLKSASWKSNGDYALIVGEYGLVLKYDSTFTPVPSITSKNLRGVAWKSDGALALITGDDGTLLSYAGSTLTPVYTDVTGWLHGISWRTGANEALAVGAKGTVLEYVEGQISVVMNRTTSPNTTQSMRGVSWKPNTQNALVVGFQGMAIEYKSPHKVGELTAVIDAISPNPANETDIITFKGHGSGGTTGQAFSYNWSFSGGQIGNLAEFKRKMPAGEHIIYFSVQDSDGTWSSIASRKLTVLSPSSGGSQQNTSQPSQPSNNSQYDIPIPTSTGSSDSSSGSNIFNDAIVPSLIGIIIILAAIFVSMPLLDYRKNAYERKIETEIVLFLRYNSDSKLHKIYEHFRGEYGVAATRRMNLKRIINCSVRKGRIEMTSEDNPKYRLKRRD